MDFTKREITEEIIKRNLEPLKIFLNRKKIHLNFSKEKRKDNYTCIEWGNNKLDILPSLKLMKCRKFNFKTMEIEEHKIPYEKVFRRGEIEIFATRNSDVMKECFNFNGACIGMKILTSDLETILHHELQHLFNNLVGAQFDEVENEYASHLAEIMFSSFPLSSYELT
jgi:hypothetical protein